jgi:AraC-like DNA-binding protein
MSMQHSFGPHLVMDEITLPPGGEWAPRLRGWSIVQVQKGMGYWSQPKMTRELFTDSVLVLTAEVNGEFRSSRLGETVLSYFCIEPERLTGLLSLDELACLNKAISQKQIPIRILPPHDPVAGRFKTIRQNHKGNNLASRLQLVLLFVDLFAGELTEGKHESVPEIGGRGRLRQLLKQMVTSEFLEMSIHDLVPHVRCSPRHLNRLFFQELGVSFREKQTELRLAKACQLLATTDTKVIDVAQASGYKSNSLFSLVFKQRFGVSPGKWRHRQANSKTKPKSRRQKTVSASLL